jgi:DNA mismatch repair protein MutH
MSCIILLQSGKRKGEPCGRIHCGYHKIDLKQNINKEEKQEQQKIIPKKQDLHLSIKPVVRMTTRPTIANVKRYYEQMSTYTFHLPITSNKGGVGLFLENQLGIPSSSATLDCMDGEIKCFPLNPSYRVKESVAVTMMDKDFLSTPFEDSKVYQKLKQTLFIPYIRNGDAVTFLPSILFTKDNVLFSRIRQDFEMLKTVPLSGKYGTYLQTRTKGTGHGSTTRAFYLRPSFLTLLFTK